MHDANDDVRTSTVSWPAIACLYLAYVGAGAIGSRIVEVQLAAIFWPPVGVLLAALLVAPRRAWPACLIAGGLAELTWNAIEWHNPLPHAVLYYAGNALEVAIGATLIRALHAGPFRLETLRELGAFLLAVLLAPIASATCIATVNAAIGKSGFAETWRLGWLGDASGLLVATPVTLVALDAWRRRATLPRPRGRELLMLAGGVGAVLAIAIGAHLPTLYGALPVVLWAAIRFQLRGAALGIAFLTTAAAFLSAPDGPAGAADAVDASSVMVPSMLGLAAILVVLVATLSIERQRAERELARLNAELETRIEARTAELRAREEELRRALAAAADADRRKDAFLAMLGHELRNPLAPIRNVTAWLAHAAADHPPVARVLPMMQRQVVQMVRLVDDLLDIARISQDRLHLQCTPVAIDDVLDLALEAAQPLIAERNHRLTVVRAGPGVLVLGDAGRLAQCVGNLLTNAAKYSEPGGRIELSARAVADAVEVIVEDHGSGITSDLLPRVFEPFVQAPRTLDLSRGGLGVGLALVRRVTELHGGAVAASSAGAGLGATFTMRLPRAELAIAASDGPADVPVLERRAS